METILGAELRQTCHPVNESSQIAACRRTAADICAHSGFDETAAGEVAIAVTEAATNILKHAGRGHILLRPLRSGAARGIEVLALDSGPGFSNLAASLQDGTTTAGSFGVGLGAMRRLAQVFDIYSQPGKGSAIVMQLWPRNAAPPTQSVHCGVVCLPMHGETVAGDSWALALGATEATVLVADGLGHGMHAAQASELAAAVTMQEPRLPAATLIQDAHGALRATRGAAVAVARIDMLHETLSFAGIGNIATYIFDGSDRRQLVSHNGIVGSNMRKVQEFSAAWNADTMLVLHSDGLASRWDLGDYPGLLHCHPALVAGVLFRDGSRHRDDVTVLVLRDREGWSP
ncbi:ATP-binding SpoIIE family protein phosphatase [Massilia endophytica]|uniref:ATP-binding SpoIIE family protein phosphatase n=1 Tax=Massilia endophytica TaxID=2899220 RepID=UPI001E42DCB9|nr:ATP-binding SpoIIE family protein phosphatase [Massilia endophytica]UGQ47293.1 ATP-binding protein [Massilia endophytica]